MLLAAAVLGVFRQTVGHGFVIYDDEAYVTKNPRVQAGLSVENLRWAFTTNLNANWHPLTWLSHMLDAELFGLNPMGHHLTSLLLHLANTILLFLLLARMTGSVWKSGFVAALFGIHPLHVESVAWVAERKDVLSALFWILTMWAYVRYTESPSVKRYLPVVVLFALGLMAKPMLVTLPFVLLLLDYWPLGRLMPSASGKPGKDRQGPSAWRLIWEKAPLFTLAAASSAVTFIIQRQGQAMGSLSAFTLPARIGNALISYAAYIYSTLWPKDLAVFYPHPTNRLPVWHAILAGLLLVGISALVLGPARRQRYMTVGWLWYVGTLVPVIGLIQVGAQARADRYTYVPLIGLFIAICWGAAGLWQGAEREDQADERPGRSRKKERKHRQKRKAPGCSPALPALAILGLAALMAQAWNQVGVWHDTVSLFRHALNATERNYVAHINLGIALAREGNLEDAMAQYHEALAIAPDYGEAHLHLAIALARQGKLSDALTHFAEAVKLNPRNPEAHNNLGLVLAMQGKIDRAMAEYRKALSVNPDLGEAHNNMALALYAKGRYTDAWREVRLAQKFGAKPNPGFLKALSQAPDQR